MDPLSTKDGKPYGPFRYKEIIKERYLISKSINTSYNDIGKITPAERTYLIEFIAEEIEKSKQLIEEQKQRNKTK